MPNGARCLTAREAEERIMPNGATAAHDNNGATAQACDRFHQWFSSDVSILLITTKIL